MPSNPAVTLYTRKGCCLCDDAKRALDAAGRQAAFHLEVIDIDSDPNLRTLYNDEVPVIAINGSKAFKYRVSVDELLRKLEARS
jgi:glutaredoxin